MKKAGMILTAVIMMLSLSACDMGQFIQSMEEALGIYETLYSEETPEQAAAYDNGAFFPYYAALSNAEKAIYRQMCRCIEAGGEGFAPVDKMKAADFNKLSMAVYLEHPDYFWFTSSAEYLYSEDSKDITFIKPQYNSLLTGLAENKAAYEAAAEPVLCAIKGLDDDEAVLYVYNYLAENVNYAKNDFDQTSFSALVNKETVCAGYAAAMTYLLQGAGIPCCTVSGKAKQILETGEISENAEGHAWNVVRVNGVNYMIDPTWGDAVNGSFPEHISYSAYLGPETSMYERDKYCAAAPECKELYDFEKGLGRSVKDVIISGYKEDLYGVCCNIEDYKEMAKKFIIEKGEGTSDISFIVYGEQLNSELMNLQSDFVRDEIMEPARDELDWDRLSFATQGSSIYLYMNMPLYTGEISEVPDGFADNAYIYNMQFEIERAYE